MTKAQGWLVVALLVLLVAKAWWPVMGPAKPCSSTDFSRYGIVTEPAGAVLPPCSGARVL